MCSQRPAVTLMPDVFHGTIVLITGASNGIGLAAAWELARMGAHVLMLCRDPSRGARACADVAEAARGPAPDLLIADMSSQASVRAVAADVCRRFDRIDVLINNAAGIFARREVTGDGIEKTFATNHVGPFLLTNLLLDRMAAGGRIVNVATEVYPSKLDFDNLQGEKSYNFLSAYFRSKLENIIFTVDLAKHLADTSITVNCMSPGPARTGFGDNLTGLAGLLPRLAKPLFPSPERAARTLVYLASSPEVEGASGRFYFRLRERSLKPIAHDRAVAARLWRISAKLAGLPVDARQAQRRLMQRSAS